MSTSQLGIKRYFKVQHYGFTRLGIDIFATKQIIKHPLITTILMSATALHSFMMLHYAVVNINDVQKVTDALNPFWQAIIVEVKFIIFIFKRKEAARLLNRLWNLNVKVSHAELAIISAENAIDIMVCTIYQVTCLATCCFTITAPLFLAIFFYMQGSGFRLEVPLKASYFVDAGKSYNYFWVWLLTATNIYHITHASIAFDSFFSWLSHNIVAQFRILKLKLECIGAENNGDPSMASLVDCIQLHFRTIEITKELNRVYSSIIFFKFLISCAQICCLAFQFSMGGAVRDLIVQALCLAAVTVQMILYCFNGQRIRDQSESIGTALYTTLKCYKMDKKKQKLLFLPVMRAHHACTLRGVFFTVDLQLFLWVFKTALSLITLLWTLADKDGKERA